MIARYDGIAPTPGATVTVRLAGTLTAAVLYADTLLTPLSNPLTADSLTGLYAFWTEITALDVVVSTGSTLPTSRQAGVPQVVFNGDSPNRTASLIAQDRCQLVVLQSVGPY